MRLLNAKTFEFEKFENAGINRALKQCAIISHRWHSDSAKEIDFQAFQTLSDDRKKQLFNDSAQYDCTSDDDEFIQRHTEAIKKAAGACSAARSDEHGGPMEYIWFDTFCINKENTRERDHAFRSMFRWYRHANICYAHINDVTAPSRTSSGEVNQERLEQFKKSEWFTRGWTLQELLAPHEIYFFDNNWELIGTKTNLISWIHKATNINTKYLKGDLSEACIAVKMSWLAQRTTTYLEDMAYCMVGIFDIDMRFEYGEEEGAFLRLQEELVRQISTDESLFAWKQSGLPFYGLLAPWPTCFAASGNLVIRSWKSRTRKPYTNVNRGIDFLIPNKLPSNGNSTEWNAINAMLRRRYRLKLNCWEGSNLRNTVTIRLKKENGQWRRQKCGEWAKAWRPRSSSSIFGPKTSGIRIPHQNGKEPKWGDEGIYVFGNKLIESRPEPED